MEPIQVFVVDDHTLFRQGLKALFSSLPEIELAGEAADGEQAVAGVLKRKPDVVLMDIQMPGLNGIEATRQILADQPDIGIIVVSMFEDEDSVFAAMRAGARGYLLKGADQDEMQRTIRAVAAGEAVFGAGLADRLMDFFSHLAKEPPEVFPELTPRENEVLELVARGMSNAEIAQELVISPKTVRNHVSNVFGKLQVVDRAQAIVRAREEGMGRRGDA